MCARDRAHTHARTRQPHSDSDARSLLDLMVASSLRITPLPRRPCTTTAECGTGTRLTCDDPVRLVEDPVTQSMATLLTELATTLNMYEPGSCSTPVGDDMSRQVFQLIGAIYGQSNGASKTKLCIGIDEWSDFTSDLDQPNSIFMQPWDGALSNGTNVFNHFSLTDTTTPLPPASPSCASQVAAGVVTPLIEYTCGGTLHVLPTSNLRFSGSIQLLHQLFVNLAGPFMQTMADSCQWITPYDTTVPRLDSPSRPLCGRGIVHSRHASLSPCLSNVSVPSQDGYGGSGPASHLYVHGMVAGVLDADDGVPGSTQPDGVGGAV